MDPRLSQPFSIDHEGKPAARSANLSPLMKAKMATAHEEGGKVNACPFGCQVVDLDEHGYCRHLIGFTNSTPEQCQAGEGLYEPMVRRMDGRVVQVEREKIKEQGVDHEDKKKRWSWGKATLPKVLPSDVLVRITSSYRVYRNDPPAAPKAEEPAKPKRKSRPKKTQSPEPAPEPAAT